MISTAPNKEIVAAIAIFLACFAGCRSQVTSVYGESDHYAARCSPGGSSVLRAMVEGQGHKVFSVRSLSPINMERLNTLVWSPDYFPNHDKETLDWIERWLSKGERTLVYIGRDYSPHAAYWKDIANQLAGTLDNRAPWLVAMDEVANAENALDSKRRMSPSAIGTPWCLWELRGGPMQSVSGLQGPWGQGIRPEDTRIEVRSSIKPLVPSDLNHLKNELDSKQNRRNSNANLPPKNAPARPPARSGFPDWESRQLDWLKGINLATLPEWQLLLSDAGNTPLIAMVEHNPISRSKIFVVNNHSLFCNYALLRSGNRQLASTMIREFSTGGVGFMAGANDPLVRSDNLDERQKGFEMLTVWPLNIVAIHAAFLGIATMIVYFPIFGRPKRLHKVSTGDFGLHIDAIGAMMQKSGDREYAIKQIADYFRIVRQETTSPWASMQIEEPKPQSPFRTQSSK